ncbi:Dynein, 70 kDa intermediate chain, flagellar outer arm [Auxenochlorella protothecoides]|uniref:Dynein, 70 kDa intermediate chain, flagellar outer arm n=1 Tax=Auxenochlorella protothecoides TaxID=3075 RepID=A0A087SFS8_AUXPR|nr:Dynein, 70 kDa intermediate chain, flagellar outer arm [Auxenochlorella protothecoides]KFM24582.1 Dynein, 70 kDa intermediate chain, flagellar outer arm [Auxenochlorella protothecoides]
MEISHQYIKQRKDFGRHPSFRNGPIQVFVDQRPDEELAALWVPVSHVTRGTQSGPSMSEHEVNTVVLQTVSQAVDATLGRWPKDVDPTDAQQVARFRKKMEKDEDYIRCTVRLGAVVEELIKENNALDIYEEYFADVPPLAELDPPSIASLATLLPEGAGEPVVRLSWRPDAAACLAVAGASRVSLWDLDAGPPRVAAALLPPSAPLTALAHSPRDGATLCAGQANGQLLVFDARRGPGAAAATAPGRSRLAHLLWTQSKTGSEVMACTGEGSVECLCVTLGFGARPSATVLEYSAAAGPTRFMVGTGQGTILAGNRRAKSQDDKITASFVGHHGHITALQRHPAFPKFFLSCGDWSARVWSEDVGHAVMATPYAPGYVTAGAWSPTRAGMALTLDGGGRLAAWDWVHRQDAPALEVPVSKHGLTALAFPPGTGHPSLVAVAAADGCTHLLQLCEGLVTQGSGEKAAMGAVLDRGNNREKHLEKAARDAKLRGRRAVGEDVGDQSLPTAAGSDDSLAASEFQEMEAEYLRLVGGTMGVYTSAPSFQFKSADEQQHLRGQLPSLLPSPPKRAVPGRQPAPFGAPPPDHGSHPGSPWSGNPGQGWAPPSRHQEDERQVGAWAAPLSPSAAGGEEHWAPPGAAPQQYVGANHWPRAGQTAEPWGSPAAPSEGLFGKDVVPQPYDVAGEGEEVVGAAEGEWGAAPPGYSPGGWAGAVGDTPPSASTESPIRAHFARGQGGAGPSLLGPSGASRIPRPAGQAKGPGESEARAVAATAPAAAASRIPPPPSAGFAPPQWAPPDAPAAALVPGKLQLAPPMTGDAPQDAPSPGHAPPMGAPPGLLPPPPGPLSGLQGGSPSPGSSLAAQPGPMLFAPPAPAGAAPGAPEPGLGARGSQASGGQGVGRGPTGTPVARRGRTGGRARRIFTHLLILTAAALLAPELAVTSLSAAAGIAQTSARRLRRLEARDLRPPAVLPLVSGWHPRAAGRGGATGLLDAWVGALDAARSVLSEGAAGQATPSPASRAKAAAASATRRASTAAGRAGGAVLAARPALQRWALERPRAAARLVAGCVRWARCVLEDRERACGQEAFGAYLRGAKGAAEPRKPRNDGTLGAGERVPPSQSSGATDAAAKPERPVGTEAARGAESKSEAPPKAEAAVVEDRPASGVSGGAASSEGTQPLPHKETPAEPETEVAGRAQPSKADPPSKAAAAAGTKPPSDGPSLEKIPAATHEALAKPPAAEASPVVGAANKSLPIAAMEVPSKVDTPAKAVPAPSKESLSLEITPNASLAAPNATTPPPTTVTSNAGVAASNKTTLPPASSLNTTVPTPAKESPTSAVTSSASVAAQRNDMLPPVVRLNASAPAPAKGDPAPNATRSVEPLDPSTATRPSTADPDDNVASPAEQVNPMGVEEEEAVEQAPEAEREEEGATGRQPADDTGDVGAAAGTDAPEDDSEEPLASAEEEDAHPAAASGEDLEVAKEAEEGDPEDAALEDGDHCEDAGAKTEEDTPSGDPSPSDDQNNSEHPGSEPEQAEYEQVKALGGGEEGEETAVDKLRSFKEWLGTRLTLPPLDWTAMAQAWAAPLLAGLSLLALLVGTLLYTSALTRRRVQMRVSELDFAEAPLTAGPSPSASLPRKDAGEDSPQASGLVAAASASLSTLLTSMLRGEGKDGADDEVESSSRGRRSSGVPRPRRGAHASGAAADEGPGGAAAPTPSRRRSTRAAVPQTSALSDTPSRNTRHSLRSRTTLLESEDEDEEVSAGQGRAAASKSGPRAASRLKRGAA